MYNIYLMNIPKELMSTTDYNEVYKLVEELNASVTDEANAHALLKLALYYEGMGNNAQYTANYSSYTQTYHLHFGLDLFYHYLVLTKHALAPDYKKELDVYKANVKADTRSILQYQEVRQLLERHAIVAPLSTPNSTMARLKRSLNVMSINDTDVAPTMRQSTMVWPGLNLHLLARRNRSGYEEIGATPTSDSKCTIS